MESHVAIRERINFSDRLKTALTAAHLSCKTSTFTRAFNHRADGAAVTEHAARKWLSGEAIPTQEKIVILATWLGVHASWLRFGDAENSAKGDTAVGVIPEAAMSSQHLALIHDIMLLPGSAQIVVRDLVDSMNRMCGVNEPGEAPKRKSRASETND